MKLFCMAASLRKGSLNQLLLNQAEQEILALGAQLMTKPFAEFDLPLFNSDLESEGNVPPNLLQYQSCMQNSDASVIVSPEYNHSIPGPLKNLIDWTSRLKPGIWKNRPVLLMSASPSMSGGRMGLWQLRIPLTACGAFVFPDMFCLPKAHEAFEGGRIKDPKTLEILRGNLTAFLQQIR